MKHKIRFSIFLFLSVAFYIGSLFFLFNQLKIFSSIAIMLAFFVSFHFLYLDLYNQPKKYFIWIMIILTIGEIPLLWHGNRGMIGGIILFNFSIYLLGNSLHSETKWTNKFSGLSYFRVGGYLFTMTLTLAYSLTSLWIYNRFPFDCSQLSEASNGVIDTLTKPLKLWRDEANKIKTDTSNFFKTTFNDAVNIWENINIESTDSLSTTLVNKIKVRKQDIITKTIEENSKLNMGICDYTLKKINEKLASPEFQFSVIIFMVFLIYPFLRILTQAMSVVAYIVFQILYRCKVYHLEKITKEVDVIW